MRKSILSAIVGVSAAVLATLSPVQSASASTCTGVSIPATGDIAATVAANPINTTFCLAAAKYRITTTIAPKAGDTIQGQPGTIISGAKAITGWTVSGTSWVASGWLPAAYTDSGYNPCQVTTSTLCKLDEWVFLDGVNLKRVASASAVVAGTFYTDYAANKVYIGSSPTGHLVEISRTRTAITSTAANVTLKDIQVEMFATQNQKGAIVVNATGWTLDGVRARYNHGAGVYDYASNMHITNSRIDHNGTTGVAAYSVTGTLIENSELDSNNTDGSMINDGENGGFKSTHSTDTIINNNVHDNLGMGLWFDIDDNGAVISGNTITNNAASGIRYEISHNGHIHDNTVTGNGLNRQQGNGTLFYGASIDVDNSDNTEVYANTVSGGNNGIGLSMQSRSTYTLTNVTVHDNYISMTRGLTGLVQNVSDTSYFTTHGNDFTNNHYTLDSQTAIRYAWQNANGGVAFWQGWGQDLTGTFA